MKNRCIALVFTVVLLDSFSVCSYSNLINPPLIISNKGCRSPNFRKHGEILDTKVIGNKKSYVIPEVRKLVATSTFEAKIASLNTNEHKIFAGMPSILIPAFIAFILDSIAAGLAMPVLPFFVTSFGANALHLSAVLSSYFVSQMLGCIIMGKISDRCGRKIALQIALGVATASYYALSQAKSLSGIVLARIFAGLSGGLIPIMQSCVLDVCNEDDHPKILGRIQAAFGIGFIIGPILSFLAPRISVSTKLALSSVFPFIGLLVVSLFYNDSVSSASLQILANNVSQVKYDTKTYPANNNKSLKNILSYKLLIMNGFALMYAFATEGIYAMLLKDSLGLGETALSYLFAGSGISVLMLQTFFIKYAVRFLGKKYTLVLGNSALAIGMIGIALFRNYGGMKIHFIMFVVHVLGYSIADTALVSLISEQSTSEFRGGDLAINQAVQSFARILSPLAAGFMYEISKDMLFAGYRLPIGALPYIVSATLPAFAATFIVMFSLFNVS